MDNWNNLATLLMAGVIDYEEYQRSRSKLEVPAGGFPKLSEEGLLKYE